MNFKQIPGYQLILPNVTKKKRNFKLTLLESAYSIKIKSERTK